MFLNKSNDLDAKNGFPGYRSLTVTALRMLPSFSFRLLLGFRLPDCRNDGRI